MLFMLLPLPLINSSQLLSYLITPGLFGPILLLDDSKACLFAEPI